MDARLGVTSVTLAVMLMAGPAAAQDAGARAFVLDQTARSLTVLDIATGRVGQTAPLQGTPELLLRTADGQRLLVLDRGEGRDAGENGFQAKTHSTLTIVDGRTLAVGPRVELGWGLAAAPMLSAAGDRLSVVCPGFQGRTPAESLPRQVVTVDLASGKVLSRVELPRRATAALATPDGQTAVVLSAREESRKPAPLPAELRFIDVGAGAIVATVALEGDPQGPVLAPDRQFVYLLDRGKPNNNPERNVNGRLHAVSMTTRAVQGVTDVGSKPRGLVLDERGQQLFLLSDGVPVKGPANKDRPGELRVIRGAAPAAPIAVTTAPERLEVSDDGATLYVLGLQGLTPVSLPGLVAGSSIKAPGMGGGGESAISRDGRRGYVLYGEYFTTYDLQKGEEVAEVRTGRMGKKMFMALEAGLEAETKRLEAQNEARRQGRSYYGYTEYTLREPHGTMAFGPDGKAIYALNSQTSDVTVIDAENGQVIEKVAAGGFAVRFMPAASVALVASPSTVHAVSLTTHQKLADVVTDTTGSFNRAEVSPDARLAVVHGSGGVLFVNAATGTPVGTMKSFGKVVGVEIDWARSR